MRNLLFLIITLVSATTFGFQPELATVKVQSGYCSGGETLPGSGILFTHKNRVLVLTSEHVVLHGDDQNICHTIFNEEIGNLPTTLLSANWGNGLALLEVSNLPYDFDLPTLEDFITANPESDNLAVTSGFTADSRTLTRHARADVISFSSDRMVFPEVNRIIEIIGHGEFGMSGGPLFNENQDSILGILSHQYLKQIPGQAAVPVSYSADYTLLMENTLFVIPSSDIKTWVEESVKSPLFSYEQPKTTFKRDSSDQVKNNKVIYADGCAFALENGKSKLQIDIIDKKIINPNGTQGGDGVGIGGISSAQQNFTIRVTLDNSHSAGSFSVPSLNRWIKRVRATLQHQREIEIPFLIKGDKIIYFNSLEQFFGELLRDETVSPLALLPASEIENSEFLSTLSKIGNFFQEKAKELLLEIHPSLEETNNKKKKAKIIEAQRLLRDLAELGLRLTSTEWVFITTSYIEDLAEADKWRELFNRYFDETVELKTNLLQLQQTLSKIKVEGN